MPSREGLVTSLELLTIIGTLSGMARDVTKIGQLLVKIPIEPFLSRAIIESMMFEMMLKDPRFVTSHVQVPRQELANLLKDGLTDSIISILALVVNFSNLFFIRKDER
jgi:HrpA-like RNA helicase